MEKITASSRGGPDTSRDDVLSHKAINSPKSSSLWNRVLERYREELKDDDHNEILAGTKSLDDLIAYVSTIQVPGSNAFQPLSRLGPKLKFVDDFSALVALCLGTNTKITAFVWGSLRLIITLASSAGDALQKVLDMLEELSLSLPRFRSYEENLPLNGSFENALVELYLEIICFYARLIRYYKDNPHVPMQHVGWKSFELDFDHTLQRVKTLSRDVEKEADLAKMRMERQKYDVVLEMLQGLNTRPAQTLTNARQHYHHIPINVYSRFRGREADLEVIRQALGPDETPTKLKSLALYGIGGVGKTQLAARYALDSKKHFDTILWIPADSRLALEQGFRDAALCLGLSQESNDGASELSATARVKDWLSDQNQARAWLLIFDNADDISLLRHVWPNNGMGSVLLTSRDFNAASGLASHGLDLQPFDADTGALILLQLLGIEAPSDEQKSEGRKIASLLGGLPLALDQIAGFISQRKMRLQDFLPLYERNSAKIDARNHGFSDYPHTLATVFDMNLSNLSGSAVHLLNLLGFLEPDTIANSIFEEGADLVQDPDFDFLADEMDLGDAEESLLQVALINKNIEERTLSIHRLVQVAVLRRLDNVHKRKYFNDAISLLSLGFPDTWSKDVGHQKKQWSRCEQYLPHVNTLVRHSQDNVGLAEQPDVWAELLLRCAWYCYEKEEYVYARKFTQTALDSFTSQATLAYASAIDLLGLIDLDINQPLRALQSFETGLSVRRKLLPPTDSLIAFALNNLAMVYTEVADLPKAEEYHRQAIKLRLQNNSDRIGNSYSNYAVTLLRMGKLDEAERILMSCPSLQGCTDDTFLQADNPRFVGDMVLLSRIRRGQGKKDDALRLASKALAWRQKVHGDRYKTCDSMYDVACLLHEHGQAATALDMLDGLGKIAGTLEAGEGHMARAEWKVGQILEANGRSEDSRVHLRKAVALRKVFNPAAEDELSNEYAWDKLTPYMLW